MALATLSIDLEARLARFEGDLGRATRLLDKFAGDATRSATSVRDVFAGSLLASGFEQGLRSVIDLFPSLIDQAGKFQDIAETTGGSAAGFAAFQTAADVAGVSIDELAGLSIKLTANLGKLTDEGKGAGQALSNLGIPIKEFQALSPDQQIKRLAAAFADFDDGVGKTSNALALFGRNGPAILKFFKEYGDGANEVTRLTADQIKAADDYADAMSRMRSEIRQTMQVFAVQAIPALTALGQGFRDGVVAVLDLKSGTRELASDRAILDFGEQAAVAIGTVAEALVGVAKLARAVGGSFQAVGADIALPFQLAGAAASADGKSISERVHAVAEVLANRNKTVSEANQRYADLWTYDGTAITTAIRKSFAAQRNAMDPEFQREQQRMDQRLQTLAGGGRRKLQPVKIAEKTDAGGEATDKTFERLLDRIRKQGELAQAELANGDKLSDADRARVTSLQDLADARGKLSAEEVLALNIEIEQTAVGMRAVDATRAEAKAKADAAAAAERVLQQLQQEVGARQQLSDRLADEVEEIGLSTRAVEELRTKRLENALATEQEAFFQAAANNATREQIELLAKLLQLKGVEVDLNKERTQALDRQDRDPLVGAQKGIDEYLKALQEKGRAVREFTRTAAQSLEDDLVGSFRNGRLEASRTIDYILEQFLRLRVVQPLMQSLFGNFGSKDSSTGGGGDAALAVAIAKFFGFASGGVFGAQAFATGGVFDSPHLFKFAQGGAMATGVLGEAGPEAVMPLRRGADGRLGVQVNGGGRGAAPINITQHITVGSGVGLADVRMAMAQTKNETIAAIADLQRRGFMQQ